MKAVKYFLSFFISLFASVENTSKQPDEFCNLRNTSTQNGEEINYTVFYAAAGIYVKAGWANFTNKIEKLNGKTVYHITGEGASNSKYDWDIQGSRQIRKFY